MYTKKAKLYIFIFLLIGIFMFNPINAYAGALNWGGVNIECIYEDGGLYSSNTKTKGIQHNCPYPYELQDQNCLDSNGKITSSCQTNGFSFLDKDRISNCIGKGLGEEYTYNQVSYKTNRMTYNLRGVSNQESATTGNTEFINQPFSNNKCRSDMRRGYVPFEDEDGNQTTTTYYKFGTSSSDTKFDEGDYDGVGFWASLFTDELTDEEWLDEVEDDDENFGLVSERYILTDEAGEPNFTLTYKQESEQAAGSDSYAYVMIYDNVKLLKTQGKTTVLETTHFDGVSVTEDGEASGLEDNDVIYLNNPEANSYLDSSSVTSYYYAAGQVRYTLSTSKTDTNNRKFVLFNVGLGTGDAPDTELCDSIMPETSKVLKRIIQVAQIAVPVLLIGLTAFDVGKIVISGNVEEELPKQKKKIMGRFIAALVFFFLPMIVMLLINMIKDTGFVNGDDIKQISCLFEP